MNRKDAVHNAPHIPSESSFKNTSYERIDFVRRREVLRETIDFIKDDYDRLNNLAQANLQRWSEESAANGVNQVGNVEVEVHAGDWGEVTQKLTIKYGRCFAALNMANAYIPGGGYLQGYVAQEENMYRRTDCHFSINRNDLDDQGYYKEDWTDLINSVNGRVYLDTDNPRICVRDKEVRGRPDFGYEWLSEDNIFPFYELRSAAIDLRSGIPFDPKECKKRIIAQFDTLIDANVKYVVLGAHGCGAFRNPSEKVADLYAQVIDEYKENFHNISFAIYSAGYGPDNFTPFAKQILHQN